ncbi:hypothetical protein ANO11243_052440 [Dothideomycetidae sp. 11243]|nr:hypothetical protein ANO11243_052440 [fungal sp. No.11243]
MKITPYHVSLPFVQAAFIEISALPAAVMHSYLWPRQELSYPFGGPGGELSIRLSNSSNTTKQAPSVFRAPNRPGRLPRDDCYCGPTEDLRRPSPPSHGTRVCTPHNHGTFAHRASEDSTASTDYQPLQWLTRDQPLQSCRPKKGVCSLLTGASRSTPVKRPGEGPHTQARLRLGMLAPDNLFSAPDLISLYLHLPWSGLSSSIAVEALKKKILLGGSPGNDLTR